MHMSSEPGRVESFADILPMALRLIGSVENVACEKLGGGNPHSISMPFNGWKERARCADL